MYKLIVRLRTNLLVYLTHQLALPVLRLIRKPPQFCYTKEALQQLPDGTLGKDLINMLEENQLQLLPYYVKHDIKHILLDYDTTGQGEVCLQCFMLGNRHYSFPVVATILFGFFTMPEYWKDFLQAYKRGRKSAAIENCQWFLIIELTTQSLIQKINSND